MKSVCLGHLTFMNRVPRFVATALADLYTPTANHTLQLPQITVQLLEVSQRSMPLHVNCNMCGERSRSCSGLCKVLQLVNNFSLHFAPFSCYPSLRFWHQFCSHMDRVVITAPINLLTPMQGLWDCDVSDVRQCFTCRIP